MNKTHSVVVWGATGFTGRLVCEHIVRDYASLKFAMAGRNQAKLEGIRADLAERYGAQFADIPILIGSLEDQASLNQIATDTSVIISTAGPFARYGTPIVEAAVHGGAHYVDITGEVPWVKSIIDKYHAAAVEKNLRIVPCCGYDSAPEDLGALFAVEEMRTRLGVEPSKILTAVAEGNGGVSGGTIATGMYQLTQKESPGVDSTSTYALIPQGEQRGPDSDVWWADYSAPLGKYLAPFIMQVCNTRVVQRSNYLLGWGGPELSYKEAVVTPGWFSSRLVALGTLVIGAIFTQSWLHPLLKKIVPAPGQGPSREQMLSGFYKHKIVAEAKDGSFLVAEMGDPARDPGYWGTSRMVLESALCLALQQQELDKDAKVLHGGVLTPASAMGMHLIERFRGAGLYFEVKEVVKKSAAAVGVVGA